MTPIYGLKNGQIKSLQTIGRTDRMGPLGTEPVVLKSIVTVPYVDVDVYVQSIVVVGRFIEFIDHWSFSVN